jgi:hypothetical protein
VTVAAGHAPSVRSLRWLVVVGALFAVAMFGGTSCGDGRLAPASVAGHGCPNVILQASLPGALTAVAGEGAPNGGHGPRETLAGACLFVVLVLTGLALVGAARRPLLTYVTSWWALLSLPRPRPPAVGSMSMDVLRI